MMRSVWKLPAWLAAARALNPDKKVALWLREAQLAAVVYAT